MKRDPILYLQDIVDSITHIENYLVGVDKNQFEKDTKIQDAIIRRLEIIGEATKNLPLSLREKYPAVTWKSIAGLRDVLIHGYLGIMADRLWYVLNEKLLPLKKDIQKIIEQEKKP